MKLSGRLVILQVTKFTLLSKNHNPRNGNLRLDIKAGIYRIWCGVNRLGDSGVHGDTSAFVNLAGQLLLTRRGKIRMHDVGIVFEFYIAPL